MKRRGGPPTAEQREDPKGREVSVGGPGEEGGELFDRAARAVLRGRPTTPGQAGPAPLRSPWATKRIKAAMKITEQAGGQKHVEPCMGGGTRCNPLLDSLQGDIHSTELRVTAGGASWRRAARTWRGTARSPPTTPTKTVLKRVTHAVADKEVGGKLGRDRSPLRPGTWPEQGACALVLELGNHRTRHFKTAKN
ncbi:hypothetical protein NDU88_005613 [Pleurodeles waltl]|uniref:Uncharacterized protein n=1 Tax=Pleurodeles waltl TaxID=8319 RepID=A0AAV7M9U8_PLEWA|nr:hypothetical protein NDU88_005613 [Pleurodeles waltl]